MIPISADPNPGQVSTDSWRKFTSGIPLFGQPLLTKNRSRIYASGLFRKIVRKVSTSYSGFNQGT